LSRARALAALVLAAAWACAVPAALGHSEVVSTAPRDGARLAAAPDAVVVTYGAPLAAAVEAAVRPPGGAALAVKPRLAAGDARKVVIPLRGGGAGRFAASWTVLGTDGHELAGSVSFVVRAPAIVAELRELAALVRRAAAALEAAREAAAAQR
jgi:methionine-rich copper-binding protein CopC